MRNLKEKKREEEERQKECMSGFVQDAKCKFHQEPALPLADVPLQLQFPYPIRGMRWAVIKQLQQNNKS